MNKTELKPCPFCGAEPFVWRTNRRTYIECPNLTAENHRVEFSGKTDEEAFKEWNRRATDEQSEVETDYTETLEDIQAREESIGI